MTTEPDLSYDTGSDLSAEEEDHLQPEQCKIPPKNDPLPSLMWEPSQDVGPPSILPVELGYETGSDLSASEDEGVLSVSPSASSALPSAWALWARLASSSSSNDLVDEPVAMDEIAQISTVQRLRTVLRHLEKPSVMFEARLKQRSARSGPDGAGRSFSEKNSALQHVDAIAFFKKDVFPSRECDECHGRWELRMPDASRLDSIWDELVLHMLGEELRAECVQGAVARVTKQGVFKVELWVGRPATADASELPKTRSQATSYIKSPAFPGEEKVLEVGKRLFYLCKSVSGEIAYPEVKTAGMGEIVSCVNCVKYVPFPVRGLPKAVLFRYPPKEKDAAASVISKEGGGRAGDSAACATETAEGGGRAGDSAACTPRKASTTVEVSPATGQRKKIIPWGLKKTLGAK